MNNICRSLDILDVTFTDKMSDPLEGTQKLIILLITPKQTKCM